MGWTDHRDGDLYLFGRPARDHGGGDVLFYPPAVILGRACRACLGFLPHNFHPARIFMGDSGSMLIGLMLAGAARRRRPDLPERLRARDVFALLAYFLLVAAVVCRRWTCCWRSCAVRAGRSRSVRTRCTSHHRLLRIGTRTAARLLLIYLWVGLIALGWRAPFLRPRWGRHAGVAVAVVVTVIPLIRGDDADDDDESDPPG